MFWIPSVGTQWRIRGHAVVLGGSGDSEVAARQEMERHLTKRDETSEWTWEKEIQKIYDGLDGKSRASFEVSYLVYPTKLWTGIFNYMQNSKEIPKDFRILVVVPEFVEALLQKPVEKKVEWRVEAEEPEARWIKS